MDSIKGQTRVVIENVQPQVDEGLYPAKRTVGERVDVTADIFGDGHDHIRGRLLYKKEGEPKWKEAEMLHVMNDIWQAHFYVDEKGTYRFTIQAWIDHFETWYDGFRKKVEANVDVHLEIQEGVQFLKTLATGNGALSTISKRLEGEYTAAIEYVMSKEFAAVVHANPMIQHALTYHKQLKITVEHAKANFSAWYELFPRSASLGGKHGTFKDVIRLLPRISAMGFDVLYLPPIHPIGKVNRKGKNNNVMAEAGEHGSPWAIGSDDGGHKDILRELGTVDDYKKLISEAKKYDIDLALDIAFQCAPDHPYVKAHPRVV